MMQKEEVKGDPHLSGASCNELLEVEDATTYLTSLIVVDGGFVTVASLAFLLASYVVAGGGLTTEANDAASV